MFPETVKRSEVSEACVTSVDVTASSPSAGAAAGGGERPRGRDDEERRRRQDADLRGVGGWADDEHVQGKKK